MECDRSVTCQRSNLNGGVKRSNLYEAIQEVELIGIVHTNFRLIK